jgi:hypothetical protein
VNLGWDPSDAQNIVGYRLYIGNKSKIYNPAIEVGNAGTYCVENLNSGDYYFAVSAIDNKGTESDFSNEVMMTVPQASQGSQGAEGSQGSGGSQGTEGSQGSEGSQVTEGSQGAGGSGGSQVSQGSEGSQANPPTVTNVASSEIGSTSATISWTTNVAANSRIDYGAAPVTMPFSRWKVLPKPASSMTLTDEAMQVSHALKLNGLNPDTTYYFRVTSSDAAGNFAFSQEFSFSTAGNNQQPVAAGAISAAQDAPPQISGISVSRVDDSSVRISWNTDKAADAQVNYGTSASASSSRWKAPSLAFSYQSGASENGGFKTAHSIVLTGLDKASLYYYRIKSKDEKGLLAVSAESSFSISTLAAPVGAPPVESNDASALAFPKFSGSNTGLMTGMALINLNAEPLSLKFTAVDDSGALISGLNITNPQVQSINPQSQLLIIDSALFGAGFARSTAEGSIKLEGIKGNVVSSLMTFDENQKLMDGASTNDGPLAQSVFTTIEPAGTKITITNSNPQDASITIELMKADGTARSSQSGVIKANQGLIGDLYGKFFVGITPEAGDYFSVRSDKKLNASILMQKGNGDISLLSGQDSSKGSARLISPMYRMDNSGKTILSVINLDQRAGTATFRLIGDSGAQIGEAKTVAIAANGKVRIDDPRFFSSDAQVAGYVEITSDGVRLAGSASLGDNASAAVYPLAERLSSVLLFPHVASSDLYITKLAIANPNNERSDIRVDLYASDGTLLESKTDGVPAQGRINRDVKELFPSLAGKNQTSGYMRLTANRPVSAISLIGTANNASLSVIVPQEAK